MPLLETKGAASAQGFGLTLGSATPAYIEDVFSTWLYTGNGSTQTITTGIDLANNGGLAWIKSRSATTNHFLFDTNRGALNEINSNTTDAQASLTNSLTAFNSNGFNLGSAAGINDNAATYVSWTFREQPKFFDVVTYTGNGVAGRTVAHNLGSAPGCMIVKRTDASDNWYVFHTSLGGTKTLFLDATNAASTDIRYWNNTDPTSTVFTLGYDTGLNASGGTYVAYLFAHNAGGFGLTGTDNVISCGSYTGSAAVNLGYEPQWVLLRRIDVAAQWYMVDTMRGLGVGSIDALLFPNLSNAEEPNNALLDLTATGFIPTLTTGTYIYIAIRRGPMKVPTTGTSVFLPTSTSVSTNPLTVTTNFPVDLTVGRYADSSFGSTLLDRLRGGSTTSARYLQFDTTSGETTGTGFGIGFQNNTAIIDSSMFAGSTNKKIYWNFRRAPSFFDEVCYIGTGANGTVGHSLGVAPELMIVTRRTGGVNWVVYSQALGAGNALSINLTSASFTNSILWNLTAPTASVFSLGTSANSNGSGSSYVNYLFATCPGVSKVGSYTGTGATQTINCGFTAGSRFVLIKATSTTGDWLVWDSARGIVAGNDPYLAWNTIDAEVTTTDWVDTAATGFELSNAGGNLANSSGVSYIFLAIA